MPYRELVRAVPLPFLLLGLIARLSYAITPLGTLGLLHSATGSYTFAGAATAAQSLATAAGGIGVGIAADRLGPRTVGVATAVLNAACAAVLVAATRWDRPVMAAAAIAVGFTQPAVGMLVRVHWARLLRSTGRAGLLPTALSYETAANELGFVAGPVLVGLLTAAVGPVGPLGAAVLLTAGTAAPFALYYSRTPPPRRTADAPRLGPLTAMVVAAAALGGVFGAVQTGVTGYAAEHAAPGSAGLLYALLAVGSVAAGIGYAWVPARIGTALRYLLATVGLLLGSTGLAIGVAGLPVAIAVAGVTIGPLHDLGVRPHGTPVGWPRHGGGADGRQRGRPGRHGRRADGRGSRRGRRRERRGLPRRPGSGGRCTAGGRRRARRRTPVPGVRRIAQQVTR